MNKDVRNAITEIEELIDATLLKLTRKEGLDFLEELGGGVEIREMALEEEIAAKGDESDET